MTATSIQLNDSTTAPVTPASGVVLYSSSGVLKALNSGGTAAPVGVPFIEITGQSELFVGTGVGSNGGSSSDNISIGNTGSFNSITTANKNVFIGTANGGALTTGNSIVAIGYQAGSSIATSSSVIAIGPSAFSLGTGRVGHIAIGDSALKVFTSSAFANDYLIAIGYRSMFALSTSGDNSVGLGMNTFLVATSLTSSVAIGSNAAHLRTSYDTATLVGYLTDAGASLTNCSAFGANTSISVSNGINLGNGAFVGINNASPAYTLDLNNVASQCGIRFSTSTTLPPTTPSSGAVLYYDGTNLKFVNSAGVVKTITAT